MITEAISIYCRGFCLGGYVFDFEETSGEFSGKNDNDREL
jgi:hypothetical protein